MTEAEADALVCAALEIMAKVPGICSVWYLIVGVKRRLVVAIPDDECSTKHIILTISAADVAIAHYFGGASPGWLEVGWVRKSQLVAHACKYRLA